MSLRASAESPDGERFRLSDHSGRQLLVFYEDKDVRTQNQALKDLLWKSHGQGRYEGRLLIVAVADVSSFNWWPAKGVVNAAIREEIRKLGTTIWCDWDGSFGREVGATRGVSNVMLFGDDGILQFRYAGAVPKDQIERLNALLPG